MSMDCLRVEETIKTVTFGFVTAKWRAFAAIIVDLPVCLPAQTTIRLDLSRKSLT